MIKYICFRFDIDTHLCMKKGVPNLSEVFSKYDSKCTFFVSMGTAFDRSQLIKERFLSFFHNTNKKEIGILPMSYKLGLTESIIAAFFNPKIGSANSKILKKMVSEGHELGLHGGRNHSLWEKNAKRWERDKTALEIQFGLDFFKQFGLPKPLSFSSPCWKSPQGLENILIEKGFSILTDTYSLNGQPYKDDTEIIQYPVNILSPQPNIGFIENLRALGYSENDLLLEFERQLTQNNSDKIIFDHPFYAGIKELKIITKMLEICIENGYKADSMKNIYKKRFDEDSTYFT